MELQTITHALPAEKYDWRTQALDPDCRRDIARDTDARRLRGGHNIHKETLREQIAEAASNLFDRLGSFIDSDNGARVASALIALGFGSALMLTVAAVAGARGGF